MIVHWIILIIYLAGVLHAMIFFRSKPDLRKKPAYMHIIIALIWPLVLLIAIYETAFSY